MFVLYTECSGAAQMGHKSEYIVLGDVMAIQWWYERWGRLSAWWHNCVLRVLAVTLAELLVQWNPSIVATNGTRIFGRFRGVAANQGVQRSHAYLIIL